MCWGSWHGPHAHDLELAHMVDIKILVPGVVTHSTDVIEHPELVAQRIGRFAACVGRENVIGGADCGSTGDRAPADRVGEAARARRGFPAG